MFIKPDAPALELNEGGDGIGDDQGSKLFDSNILTNLGEIHNDRNNYSSVLN